MCVCQLVKPARTRVAVLLPTANKRRQIHTDGMSKIKTQLLVSFKLQGKEIPLQTWTSPEGSRRLRLPDFETVGT